MKQSIEIEFELPEDIVKGLLNGTLKRVGGVIRETDGSQILKHLREIGTIGNKNGGTAGSLPGNTLNALHLGTSVLTLGYHSRVCLSES